MKILHKMMDKYNEICIILWLKWMFYSENLRLKLENFIYKMDKKL